MQRIEQWLTNFSAFMWGTPLVVLLVGGGIYFLLYSRLIPYLHFGHALGILSGKYDRGEDQGQISHFQALATALSGTLGLGNISGVALAITMGGPGAVFWMWVTALVGVATKFFTASLAVMYRGYDSAGQLQGGPMYVIREALGPRWMPLAIWFCFAGLFGTLPMFQVNQLVQILRDVLAVPNGYADPHSHFWFDLSAGVAIAIVVLAVILGNVKRVGALSAALVPVMVIGYTVMTAVVLIKNAAAIPDALSAIFSNAFRGDAVAGGAAGSVILIGVRRGAFSNEAGIGTESMAHGAARTNEPIREGLVAMLGPAIDTLLLCTCTALAVLVTGVWTDTDVDGVTMTARGFETALPGYGAYATTMVAAALSISTIFCYWYYGSKCLGFLLGAHRQHYYVWAYVGLVVVGAVVSLDMVLGLIDGMYAAMAIPTMISALVLSPRVMRATRDYFARRREHSPWRG